eukprot:881545-Pleurochrysis_carterae.AAC.1
MVELARHACSGDGTLDMERGQKLFVELFKRLSREAMRRRTRGGGGALDIAAQVAEVVDKDLEAARRIDV